MGVFDKWKDKLVDRAAKAAAEQSAAAAKLAARKSAEAALAAAKGAGRKLEEALFGEREAELPATTKENAAEKKQRADEMGARLREADRRVKEREQAERDREARAARDARLEREVDADLAALKKKLDRS